MQSLSARSMSGPMSFFVPGDCPADHIGSMAGYFAFAMPFRAYSVPSGAMKVADPTPALP